MREVAENLSKRVQIIFKIGQIAKFTKPYKDEVEPTLLRGLPQAQLSRPELFAFLIQTGYTP